MEKTYGTAASPGIVRARAFFYERVVPVSGRPFSGAEAELARFLAARDEAVGQLLGLRDKASVEIGEEEAAIFEIGAMMLQDEDYAACVEEAVRDRSLAAERAVAEASESFSAQLAASGDAYLSARAADVKDASARVVGILCGGRTAPEPDGPVVLVADDLLPSETVSMDRSLLLGIATSGGSPNAHTAILARSMGIPAVVCLGPAAGRSAHGRDVVLDGDNGVLVLDPDAAEAGAADSRAAEAAARKASLQSLRGLENRTRGGRLVDVFANAGSQADVEAALANDAGGIGLLRSEFLYLEKDRYPTEEELFSSYRAAAESMAGRKVVIRTLDVGADKSAPYLGLAAEENPALGLRAVRLCLSRPALFNTQLRAILRASAYGTVAIMFPMIATVRDVEECLRALDGARAELQAEGVSFDPCLETGIMIETPAAALVAADLASLVDFFSVGTNDLAQYTLAADRQNAAVRSYYDQGHPAVMRLIGMAARAAKDAGLWIGVCGELAADASRTAELLAMGVDELSVSPSSVLALRARIRELD
ncbi:MAG: phosphoenolpyruvate--protein phosphotransferase [Spirochaetae bacterium HGW-Spirochaetae-3]|nr:MAG: phosphoenolpyruvate--protein phosphotransferase [Spirochaetae bacterium HGW-Spirochaetae-3]